MCAQEDALQRRAGCLAELYSVTVRVRKPSVGALLLGLIPFIAMCFSVSLWDRIDPIVLGLPFNLFWLIAWILLSTLCMWAAYRVEVARDGDKKSLGSQ